MAWETVASMFTAITIIVIILVSGGARLYTKKKFSGAEHFSMIDDAVKRQNIAKRKLHHVQTR